MNLESTQHQIESALESVPQVDNSRWFETVLGVVREWLQQTDVLPSREVVLAAVRAALVNLFKGIDTPGPDAVLEPLYIDALVFAVGYIYDQILGARGGDQTVSV